MHQCRVQAAAKQPDDIGQQRQAARIGRIALHLPAKREQHQPRQLKTLQAPGYAHYRNAQHNAAKKITQRCKKAAEDEPDEIAEEVHGFD